MAAWAIGLGGLALAYLASDLLFRWMGVGALAHGPRNAPLVSLTFDDGPDPATTPRLLKLLGDRRVRATFFVLGERAERHPELVQAIRQAGHEVASHGRSHRLGWLLFPPLEWRQVAYDPGGLPLYRPPHGLHTPFTRVFARRLGRRVALWDLESRDWTDEDPAALADRVLEYAAPGSVILLHDGREATLAMLPRLIEGLASAGYRLVPMGDQTLRPLGFKEGLIRALQGMDERYDRAHGIRHCRRHRTGLFRCAKAPYRGPALPGVAPGSVGLELHFDSRKVAALPPLAILRALRADLEAAARRVADDPEIALVFARTGLVEGARELLGFEVAELPPLDRAVATAALRFFEWLYRDPRYPKKRSPGVKLVYARREAFLRRYLKEAGP